MDNGGNAFPTHETNQHGVVFTYHGMSLLDYFAGLAMQGILASGQAQVLDQNQIANKSYIVAKAMLAEKRKRENQPSG